MEVVLKSPVLSEDGWLSAHVLYLPPHFYHEVESKPDSLAVHTFFMPRLLHQHPDATIWATSSGAQEQAKVLQETYDKWKRENHISERHVKEGGGGKGGGGGNKRARDGDGSAADMEAPSKKPALETGEALLYYLPRVALPTYCAVPYVVSLPIN